MAGTQNFFADGAVYDRTMARFSRVAGSAFLQWLDIPEGLRWLDVGCGTGAFTELILDHAAPAALDAIDPSADQIAYARTKPSADRVGYHTGDAAALTFGDGRFDVAVMALVVQYIPEENRDRAMAELARVVRPGGTIAAYVWPKLGGNHPLRPLREAVAAVGGPPSGRPEGRIRTIPGLLDLFGDAGLEAVEAHEMEIELAFENFDDFWSALQKDEVDDMSAAEVDRIQATLRDLVPPHANGQIRYKADVNVIRGRVPAP